MKIRLESDGSLLDVDEDDVEKVFNHQINSEPHQLRMTLGEYMTALTLNSRQTLRYLTEWRTWPLCSI